MKVDVELKPFTPLLRPTYADAHAGAISEVRMEGYEFGHTYVWSGPGQKYDMFNENCQYYSKCVAAECIRDEDRGNLAVV